jgi:hypothetical protein
MTALTGGVMGRSGDSHMFILFFQDSVANRRFFPPPQINALSFRMNPTQEDE